MPTSQKVQGQCVLAMRRSTGKGRLRTDFKVWGKGKRCGWVAPSGFRGHLFKSGVGRGKEEGRRLPTAHREKGYDGHYKQDEIEVILLQNIESTRKKIHVRSISTRSTTLEERRKKNRFFSIFSLSFPRNHFSSSFLFPFAKLMGLWAAEEGEERVQIWNCAEGRREAPL